MKTVRDLIETLQTLNPDLLVSLSSDGEGNSIEDWSGSISHAVYNENEDRGYQFSTYIYTETQTEDGEWDEEEVPVSSETATAIIIWP